MCRAKVKQSSRKTLRDLRNFITEKTAKIHRNHSFFRMSEAHVAFCQKLEELSSRAKAELPVDVDKDDTILLSKREWRMLESEFWSLLR